MSVRIARMVAVFFGLLLAFAAGSAEVVIGQVAQFSDREAAGPYLRIGLQVCFDAVNQAGGIHGASIKFVPKERGLKASEALAKTQELLKESEPLLLAGLMGTGSMEGLVKSRILEEAGIAVVGMRTGATSLHQPVNPYLFHTRANYEGEITKVMTQFATIGINRIAVFHEDSPFGQEGLALAQGAIQKNSSMQLAGAATYKANTSDVKNAVRSIHALAPQGVLVVAASPAAAEFYKAFRNGGGKAQVVAISVADAGEVIKRVGKEHARGLIVTQVVPDVFNKTIPIIRELHKNMAKFAPAGTPVNQAVVEGYLAGKTVVEALRIAGPNPTRRKIRTALESMKEFDAGGVIIGFSPTNHTGAKFVETAIILPSGKLMR